MINLDLLAKVWALTNSTNPGEAAAARARAKAMVERAGRTLADVPGLIATNAPSPFRLPGYDPLSQEQRFRDVMSAERARMTPEQRAASEALQAWLDRGCGWASMRWKSLTAAQQKALTAMAEPGAVARRRKGTIFDLFDASSALVAVKIAMEPGLSKLLVRGLVDRVDADTFRIAAAGRQVVELGQIPAPPGPYDIRTRTETNGGWKNIAAWCLANGKGFSDWETGMLREVASANHMPHAARRDMVERLRQSIERRSGARCPYKMDEFSSASM